MKKRFLFFLYATSITQLLAACVHSLGFIVEQKPSNETEAQLLQLMRGYKIDLGAGFTPTMQELFTSMSACFSLLCLLAGLINLHLARKCKDVKLLKGLLAINGVVFIICFAVMAYFTFLPPIVLTGLIALFSIGAYVSVVQNKSALT